MELDYKITLPPKYDYGIGIVGCGGIISYATLPCYTKHGLNVVNCYDLDTAKAMMVADCFNIPRVSDSLHELLSDPDIDIIEIAVPPWEQRDIAHAAAMAGKHLLCQKPLSDNYHSARQIVRSAYVADVKLAVNQQLRWSPAILASYNLIRSGWLGQITECNFHVSVNTPWQMWPWLVNQPYLEVQYHSIHYLDVLRHWFGEPYYVTARHNCDMTRADIRGETKTVTILEYANAFYAIPNLVTTVYCNHCSNTSPVAAFQLVGTRGFVDGTIGTMYNYPTGRNDTLCGRNDEEHFATRLTGQWLPDAMLGPISSLMTAMQFDTQPLTSGYDNLHTLALVDACYRSANLGHTITMSDIP